MVSKVICCGANVYFCCVFRTTANNLRSCLALLTRVRDVYFHQHRLLQTCQYVLIHRWKHERYGNGFCTNYVITFFVFERIELRKSSLCVFNELSKITFYIFVPALLLNLNKLIMQIPPFICKSSLAVLRVTF